MEIALALTMYLLGIFSMLGVCVKRETSAYIQGRNDERKEVTKCLK